MSPLSDIRYLHMRSEARGKYGIENTLFSYGGCLRVPEIAMARDLSHRINSVRGTTDQPPLSAGHLYAAGLLHEIQHHIIALYEGGTGKTVLRGLAARLERGKPADGFSSVIETFAREFAPAAGEYQEAAARSAPGAPPPKAARDRILLEEILLLRIANENPALKEFSEFISDGELRAFPAYRTLLETTENYLSGKAAFGKSGISLVAFLLAPIKAHPGSLSNQLSFIAREWREYIGDYILRILGNLDLMREEEKPRGGGPGPARSWSVESLDLEYESYSPDTHWMPKVVLIAKSVHVWLWQLSRQYERRIEKLDQIPDEELDLLQSRGFTGLWLIGLWERSPASRTIKRSCGNPEAAASAYSVFSYEIARELGGWDALYNLRHRCLERGIRLASDMVPNHTGIDSEWIRSHPDWFIQTDIPPFPGYSFTGQNLSSREGIEIYLEDHYYDRTDAAVVFKRVDSAVGDARYIYHGNDGTHMPWNDTAQLNFLLPEVREEVIRTIVHVAKTFPIIRFDAAMTLARKHFQRLWFPEPGTGGDIPSRAECGIASSVFKELMPNEFWRDVVDRIGKDAPDTLLLAEAFWLMEIYFVRTLGMHRVYNSAFMHMLKNEDNKTYRESMKKILEFDPEILKRFVNFMNNPDEETAAAQFGKGDKYFGVCALMVTLPGLPMFGHGQVEGFAEKYGMEYTRAYLEETPEEWFIARHETEIFPLMKRRYLFAEVDLFLLFDFSILPHIVDENVYAFLNGFGGERALVFYNNRIERTAGWIRESAPMVLRSGQDGRAAAVRQLYEGLGIRGEPGCYTIFREQKSSLWYIRSSVEIRRNGFSVSLEGYESRVFVDFYEVEDASGFYGLIAERLCGRGTPDISFMFKEAVFHDIHDSVEALYRIDLAGSIRGNPAGPDENASIAAAYAGFLGKAQAASEGTETLKPLVRLFLKKLRFCMNFHGQRLETAKDAWKRYCGTRLASHRYWPEIMEGFLFFGDLHLVITDLLPWTGITLMREWGIDERIRKCLAARGVPPEDAGEIVREISMMITHKHWYLSGELYGHGLADTIRHVFEDRETRTFLRINRYDGVQWFNKERFEDLAWLLVSGALFDKAPEKAAELKRFAGSVHETAALLLEASESASYRVEDLFTEIEKKTAPSAPGSGAAEAAENS